MAEVQPASSAFHLRDAVEILWRRKWLILVVLVLSAGSAFFLSARQTAEYRATASVVVVSQIVQPLDPSAAGAASRVDMQTELEFVNSDAVRAVARERVEAQGATVSVSVADQGSVLRFSGVHPDPRVAAEAANAYAEAYVDTKLAIATSAYQDSLALLEQDLQAARAELDALRAPIVEKQAEIAEAPNEDARQRLSDELAALQLQLGQQVQALDQQIATLNQQLLELTRESATVAESGPRLTRAATVPSEPFTPDVPRDVLLALAAGLIVGLGLAFLVDYFDDSIRSSEDLERALGGVPVIGAVPEHRRSAKRHEVETIVEPYSNASESYRSLRTSLDLAALERSLSILLITSASKNEGKSTIAANLAVSYARAGKRVVLVSCDLRAPSQHRNFGCSNAQGLTTMMLDEATDAIVRADGIENLVIIPSGPPPPDPAQLLGGTRIGELLQSMASQADVVLLDTAPVLPVADTLALCRHADAVLFVAAHRRSSRRAVHRAAAALRRANASMVGAVLAITDTAALPGYGYGYGYGPSAERNGGNRWWKRREMAAERAAPEPPREPVATPPEARATRPRPG